MQIVTKLLYVLNGAFNIWQKLFIQCDLKAEESSLMFKVQCVTQFMN